MSFRFQFLLSTAIFTGALACAWGSPPLLNDHSQPLQFSRLGQERLSTELHTASVAPNDDMTIRVLTYDPLIVHFTSLITPEERVYLKALGQPLLQNSTILIDGQNVLDPARTSSSAYLPSNDTVIRRIADRVHKFQGYMDIYRIDMQVTAYQEGQQYIPHYDWYQDSGRTTQRFSTVFATLDADCENCGTHFPELRIDWSARGSIWCQWFDCSKNFLTTKNIPGGGLFWRNLDEQFVGRRDVLHAGLPAAGGSKIGLNIWTEIYLPPVFANDQEDLDATASLQEEYDVQAHEVLRT